MLSDVIYLVLITFVPVLELRASIPYGIFKTDIHWLLVFFICVAANIILGMIIYYLLDKIVPFLTRIKLIEKIYNHYIERTQKKILPLVDRYGGLAIAIFIGIPLPGSGVYSGALAAYIIGLNFRKFAIANLIGVLIAGIIVTIISLTGLQAFQFLIKVI